MLSAPPRPENSAPQQLKTRSRKHAANARKRSVRSYNARKRKLKAMSANETVKLGDERCGKSAACEREPPKFCDLFLIEAGTPSAARRRKRVFVSITLDKSCNKNGRTHGYG